MESTQALQVYKQERPLPEVSREQIIKYLDTFGLTSELNDQEKNQFIEIAEAYQLNPFKREIYCVPYGEGEYRRLSIITGYEVFIKRAERTGKLDGWHAWVEGESEDNFKAIIEIYRKDWTHPFRHEVYWKEAAQHTRDGSLTQFWRKMPRFQLRKVGISQGFRLCFPDELGGMPYDSSELPEEMGDIHTVSPDTSSPDAPPSDLTQEEPLATGIEKPSRNPVLERLAKRLLDNKDCFSENHFKWIDSQMENDSSDPNLKKLEKHIDDVIKVKKIDDPLSRMKKASELKRPDPAQKKEPVLIF